MSFFKKALKAVTGGFLGDPLGFLGGGLELLGAGKQLFGSGPPSAAEQSYGSLMGAFKAADEAGLHRLAVAGSPAGYSPAPMSEAQGIMDAGSRLREASLPKGPSQAKQNELIDAQIAEARSRTVLNEANAVRSASGMFGGGHGANRHVAASTIPALDRALGGGERDTVVEPERNMPARTRVTLGEDDYVVPNPEAFETGLTEMMNGLLFMIPQFIAREARRSAGTGYHNRRKPQRRVNAPQPRRPRRGPS